MSSYPAPQPLPPKPAESDTNIWGIVGLIMGLFGFFTWITAPVGLVMSYIGLKHPRNGIAIAGLIVSIFSTLYALTAVVILVLWFGAIATMCGSGCFCLGLASDEMALQRAVQDEAAVKLQLQSYEVEIRNLTSNPPFGTDSRSFDGTAVYTDENGQKVAVDISGDVEKVDGQWEVTNLNIDSEPYEWIDPFADDEFNIDGEFDAGMSDDSFDSSIEGIDGTVLDGSDIDGSAPPDDTFNREAPDEDDPFADPNG